MSLSERVHRTLDIAAFISVANNWGSERIPFFFLLDFELRKPLAIRLDDLNPDRILYSINGSTNVPSQRPGGIPGDHRDIMRKYPIPVTEYEVKYRKVLDYLQFGDSYLTNLTIETGITLNASLKDLFYLSQARYKLLYEDQFLVFSPEIFVQIRGGRIFSYPMKGTIDAMAPDARQRILSDRKELAEHVTIVDLIRNDLSQVARRVSVSRFRFVEELRTSTKNLLQVSSEITGELPHDYRSQLGDILVKLLPAGSVSGAPKARTLEIIREAEGKARGYYTGVFGWYDGNSLDSGVMIRYIEKNGGEYVYRSGGGITTQSVPDAEYQEAIDKVYVPFD